MKGKRKERDEYIKRWLERRNQTSSHPEVICK